MRLQFIASEIAVALRRNLTMTVAVVVTVAISLFFLGAGLLLRQQVDVMKGYWYDKVEVAIFLCGTGSTSPGCAAGPVTPEQREELQQQLRLLPQVEQVYYESSEEAYRHFKQSMPDSDIVDAIKPSSLPESFRVKLTDPNDFPIVASAFEGRPGVDEVQDQRAVLDKLFRVLNGLQLGALGFALIQLVAAALLISNTIRVAAFSRRRETGIMRLVGASNFYIQLPFILEGAVAGLVGAVLAAAALAGLVQFLVIDRLEQGFPITRYIGWSEVWGTVPVLLVTGAALAAAAAFVTLRRYLRV
ncbi:MAG: permease-like cell division protein FtsX [Actinomycetales bacterium]